MLWPTTEGRLIPIASKSIRVSLLNTNGSSIAAPKILVRPSDGSNTTTAEWTDLPIGQIFATAEAFPDTDGSGVAQASATAGVEIRSQETSEVRLTMNSTIHEVRINPPSLGFPIELGPSPLVATAYNDQNEVVLTADSKWQWSISPAGIATLSATTGTSITVTGVGFGTATITATELESGKSGSASVEVRQGSYAEDGKGLANSPWPKFMGTVGNNGIGAAGANKTDGTLLWTTTLSGDWSTSFSSPIINVDDSVIVLDANHPTALEPGTGEVRWTFKDTITELSPACGADGTVYFVGSGGYLYAINGQNGAFRWKTLLDPKPPQTLFDHRGEPTIGSNGKIYVCYNGKLRIVDALTGRKVGESNTDELWEECPAIDSHGHLYLPAKHSSFYAFYADGTLKWKTDTAGIVYEHVAVGPNGNILTSSRDNSGGSCTIVLLNASDGSVLWKTTIPCNIVRAIRIGPKGHVFVLYVAAPTGPSMLTSLDYATGTTRWTTQVSDKVIFSQWLVANADEVVFSPYRDSTAGVLGICATDGNTGARLWTRHLGREVWIGAAFSRTGVLYCGDPGSGNPRDGVSTCYFAIQ